MPIKVVFRSYSCLRFYVFLHGYRYKDRKCQTSIFYACLLNLCVLMGMQGFLFVNNPAERTGFSWQAVRSLYTRSDPVCLQLSVILDPSPLIFALFYCVHVTYKFKGLYLFQTTGLSVIMQDAGLLLFSDFVQVRQRLSFVEIVAKFLLNIYVLYSFSFGIQFSLLFRYTHRQTSYREMMQELVTQPGRVQSSPFARYLITFFYLQQQHYLDLRYAHHGTDKVYSLRVGDLYLVTLSLLNAIL